MKRSLHIVWHLLFGIVAIVVFGAAFMLLWNALLPQIFGITVINFWQSLGLLMLLAGLSKFMAISAFWGMRGYRRNPIREKWMKMTPEERKEFIQNRHHFGHGFRHGFFNNEESEKKN
ncbi:MAG: hypothetical protein LBS01_08465 [Prevotellaceae bacterium]|jgi:hypothetical protein|nr:hypothetical protein [Prevotellaceae bacterium]